LPHFRRHITCLPPTLMASPAAQKRLTKEYASMQKQPPPFVYAVPDENNILTWNYIIRGPSDCPYAGGEYHGVLLFPPEYPFRPPGIKMYTPSGRFQPDKKICFSMSDFHPGTWNPAWSVATILTALLSFMLSDEMTTGSMTTTEADKRTLAKRSHDWNRKQKNFYEAFPEYCDEAMKDLPNMGEKEKGQAAPPLQRVSSIQSTSDISLSSTLIPATAVPAAAAPIPNANATAGFAGAWRRLVWDKWRWGVLIAFAVVVSRISS